jgi:amino-acid N-acetyltransferase
MTRLVRVSLRTGSASHAAKIHALIAAHVDEGHLLPRTLADVTAHAERFVVALRGRTVVGCAELATLSDHVAEVRSLAVDAGAREAGVGAMLVEDVRRRARKGGFDRLCAFTHTPGYFIRLGFSIVPHLWLPEKIFSDCVKCPLFRQCGQYAMVAPLEAAHDPVEQPRPGVAVRLA